MRRAAFRFAPRLLLGRWPALLLLVAWSATGAGTATRAPQAAGQADGTRSQARSGGAGEAHRGCAGKPSPAVGDVRAQVVSRPSPDRALVEVAWKRGPRGERPELEVVLPEGASLREGRRWLALGEPGSSGTTLLLVDVPPGDPLDLVVRLRASTPDGPIARETALRLGP